MIRYVLTSPKRPDDGGQRGVTLIELLVGMVIAVAIIGVLASAVSTTFRTARQTEDSVDGSNGALQTSAWFADDVTRAWPMGRLDAVRRDVTGCGGETAAVRIAGDLPGDLVRVQSYARAGSDLVRRVCTGATLSTALSATPTTTRLVRNLSTASDATVVTCQRTRGGALSPDDADCRLVKLTVRNKAGFAFTVTGRRDDAVPPNPPGFNHQCTLSPGADATVDEGNALTNWGYSNIQGLPYLDVYKGSGNWLHALVKFDLSGACQGDNEPPYLPAGKRLVSAKLSFFYIQDPTGGGNATFRAYALGSGSSDGSIKNAAWEEGEVTWCSAPFLTANGTDGSGTKSMCAGGGSAYGWDAIPAVTHDFDVNNTPRYSRAPAMDVYPEVKKWYTGAWTNNNGWRIQWVGGVAGSRSGTGVSYRFGSMEGPLSRRPLLVVVYQ